MYKVQNRFYINLLEHTMLQIYDVPELQYCTWLNYCVNKKQDLQVFIFSHLSQFKTKVFFP
jgi:hypothetical protein